MPFYQTFMRILGEGRPLGVHVVATADRSGIGPDGGERQRLAPGGAAPGRRIQLCMLNAQGCARRAFCARSRHRRRPGDADRHPRRHPECRRADQTARGAGHRPARRRRQGGRRGRRPAHPPVAARPAGPRGGSPCSAWPKTPWRRASSIRWLVHFTIAANTQILRLRGAGKATAFKC